jgi:DNA modification methylase
VHADCTEWLRTAPEADLLLTDPPYTTDVDDIQAFASTWLPLARQTRHFPSCTSNEMRVHPGHS